MNIYFFCCPPGPAERTGYEHEIVALIEGLIEQGITPKANVNYWLKTCNDNDYLIREYHPKDLNEFDVIIFSSEICNYEREDLLPDNLFSSNRRYKLIFIDSSDGLITPGFNEKFRNVDFVLKSHYSKKYKYPKNFIPWQFGLTNRIIEYASKNNIPFEQRNPTILSNFRIGHTLRDTIEDVLKNNFYQLYPKNAETDSFDNEILSDIDFLFWKQTGRRHYPNYYKRLNENMISNASGGYLQKSITNKKGLHFRVIRKIESKINFFKYDRVYQFDSWRFWESLVSGCCTIHVDFKKYGIQLPEMPVNGIHYIGLDLDNPRKALKVFKDINQLQKISENSKSWVLKNYSPLAVSTRLLNLIKM